MATFTTRDGRTTARIRKVGYPKQTETFSSEKLAQEWAEEIEKNMGKKVFVSVVDAKKTTLFKALEDYEEKAKEDKKGYEQERYRIAMWKSLKLSQTSLFNLNEVDFFRYREERQSAGVSDATIKNDLYIIRSVFSAKKYGIPCPVAAAMKGLKPAEKRDRRLSKDEARHLLNAIKNSECSDVKRTNHWVLPITLFAITTAARLSEILNLEWKNVRMESRRALFIDTKSNDGKPRQRWVPLSSSAIDCIEQAEALSPGRIGKVFKTTGSAIDQSWARAKRRAQANYAKDGGRDESFLVDFHFHDNRHEAASVWSKHFDLFDLKAITGHSDIRSLDRYVNKSPDDITDIANRMSDIEKAKAK